MSAHTANIMAFRDDPGGYADPARFGPDRWLGPDAIRPSTCDALPFGGGHRVCVGGHFAVLGAVMSLGTVARRVRCPSNRVDPIEVRFTVTQRPVGGVRARVGRR